MNNPSCCLFKERNNKYLSRFLNKDEEKYKCQKHQIIK